jgi:hypothetical protein
MIQQSARFTCLNKKRDKYGNILSFYLQDSGNSHGKVFMVEKDRLKQLIKNGTVYVENLSLTSDDRLIDRTIKPTETEIKMDYQRKHPEEIYTKFDDIQAYTKMSSNDLCNAFEKHGANNKQISYLRYKFSQGKTSSKNTSYHMKQALIIGLCAASIAGAGAGAFAGEGAMTAHNLNKYAVTAEANTDELASSADKLESATSIYVDFKISPVWCKTNVYVGKYKVASMEYDPALLDNMTLTDTDGNTLSHSDQILISATKSFKISDESGNVKYTMRKNIVKHGVIKENFSIYDENDNEIAYIKQDNLVARTLTGKNDIVYDAETNQVIATIESGSLMNDFTLTIQDSSKFSNKDLVLLARLYRANVDQSSSNSSSSSDED